MILSFYNLLSQTYQPWLSHGHIDIADVPNAFL